MTQDRDGSTLARYEAALWSVLGAMAYLARGNAALVYPDILWLFSLLLSVSLASAWAVRRWPRRDWPHALGTVLSFCVIAAIQARSGGARSNLWVLYLLPLFSAALLLRGRELALIAIGASLCDAVLYLGPDAAWGPSVVFELAVKTGVLWAAAGSTWILVSSERRARRRVEAQRAELDRLAEGLKQAETARGRDQALAAAGLASAAVAHDMATPLLVIRGYARVRLDQAGLDEGVRNDLERIERAAIFCQRLASGTLAQARGEAREGERSSLLRAIEGAVALSEEILSRQGVAVRRDYADEDFTVLGDGHDMERVFLNLIANAAKAMPDGGTLTVRARAVPTPGGRAAEASVEDTGSGVPDELLPRLFSPFVTTRAGKGGTGLGLYLCRETARRHGGDLVAVNLPRGGARFVARLPLEPAAAPAAA